MAGRIVREADTAEKPAIDIDQIGKNVKDGLTKAGDTLSSFFTQENLDVSQVAFYFFFNSW